MTADEMREPWTEMRIEADRANFLIVCTGAYLSLLEEG